MKNRGPDNQSYYQTNFFSNNIVLLHSRLSIIDIDARSNQPFIKDNFVIIFNGEIYNFIEIKEKLKKLGHNFVTNSDTEVIVEAYRRYKNKCVDYFEGMWAFVIYDNNQKEVFLSRDRLGEKPLYLLEIGKTIYFGSEPKFIFSLINKTLNINLEKLKRFLVCGYRSVFKQRESFFSQLKELEPATNLVISNNLGKKYYKYWNIKFSPIKISEEEISEEVKRLLYNSVKIRLRSDIPIAFCLSGGIDSSSLAAISGNVLNHRVRTFSVVDDDYRYDESANINLISDYLNCENTSIKTANMNFIEQMEKIIAYYNAPIPTISYFIHNQLSKYIKSKGFSVAISGTGADEIFSGYYDHYLFWLYEMRKEENFSDLLSEMKNGYGKYINNPLLKDPLKIIKDKNFRDHLYQSADKFEKIIEGKVDFSFKEKEISSDLMRNRMLNELLDEVVPTILFSDDLNSMMYSIENRSPFLDIKLIQFLFTVPTKYLIKNGLQKSLLRNCVKEFLPESILMNKKKVGFNASINSLVNLKSVEFKEWLLCDSSIFEIINKKEFIKILDEDFTRNDFSKFLFNFISSKIFMDSSKNIMN